MKCYAEKLRNITIYTLTQMYIVLFVDYIVQMKHFQSNTQKKRLKRHFPRITFFVSELAEIYTEDTQYQDKQIYEGKTLIYLLTNQQSPKPCQVRLKNFV